jgi:hypothetical protein
MTTPAAPDNTYDLDLDTLSQSKKRVKIAGQVIEFDPPALEDLIEVAKLGGELQKLQAQQADGSVDAEFMGNVMDKLKNGLANIVPELKEHKLNINQLMALINLFVESAQPADAKELEKRGVSMTDDQKKTASD